MCIDANCWKPSWEAHSYIIFRGFFFCWFWQINCTIDGCLVWKTLENNCWKPSWEVHSYIIFRGFFFYWFWHINCTIDGCLVQKTLENQNTMHLCNQTIIRKKKITLIWNPVHLIPKSHNIVPLPLNRELTLKCKKEAREGLGLFWTLPVTWQRLCTQQALTLCMEF